MRHIWIAVALGSAVVLRSGSPLFAAPLYGEPQVIGGIGPGVVYDPGQGYVPAEPPHYRAIRPMPVRARSSLGGGLLEAIAGAAGPEQGVVAGPAPAAYPQRVAAVAVEPQADPYAAAGYAVQPQKAIDPMFQRQEVAFTGAQAPGTIVIDTKAKFLYLVQGGGRAMRYGIGVGRPGFLWTGSKTITRKAEWPDWTPPPEMIKRRPDLPSHMVGGIANPLGARAMYLGSSLYRIHGTNEPETIGTNVSSGCIRLTNEDVSDLYGRVKVGTHVIVL